MHLWTVSPPRPLTSFAAVMATGIVWLDAAAEGLGGLSLALLAIGLAVCVAAGGMFLEARDGIAIFFWSAIAWAATG